MAGRRRFKKKSKRNWRKSDLLDVEKFLEDDRTLKRIRLPKKVESLYKVDKSNDPLPIGTKKLCGDTVQGYANASISKKKISKSLSKYLDEDEPHLIRVKAKPIAKKKTPLYDLWSKRSSKVAKPIKSRKPIIPSKISEIPHSGLSYNPHSHAYNDSLARCAKLEEKVVKEEMKKQKAVEMAFKNVPKYNKKELERFHLQEMLSGLPCEKKPSGLSVAEKTDFDEDKSESDDENNEKFEVKGKQRDKSKRAQKRRIKKSTRKAIVKNSEGEAKLNSDVDRVDEIWQELSEEFKSQRLRRIYKKAHSVPKHLKVYQKLKVHKSLSEMPLPEELSGSMRKIMLSSNSLFKDYSLHIKSNKLHGQ